MGDPFLLSRTPVGLMLKAGHVGGFALSGGSNQLQLPARSSIPAPGGGSLPGA